MPPNAAPIDRSEWPLDGPHRRLLELFDRLREAHGRPGLRLIASRMAQRSCPLSHETLNRRLRGLVAPQSQGEAEALVKALGGSDEDVTAARHAYAALDAEGSNRTRHRERQVRARPAGEPRLPRLIARDRDALLPAVLPPMPRLATVERGLRPQPLRAGTGHPVTFLVGDGGLGKSVLLGQVLQRIDASPPEWAWRCGMFVSCAAVLGGLTGPDDVDRSMAEAAGVADAGNMLALLRRMHDEHGSPVLIIDTLDLLLTDGTFAAIAGFLARASDLGDVLVTCRSHEFSNYFGHVRQSTPQLSGRIAEVSVPELTGPEIVEWTRSYLNEPGVPLDPHQQGFLTSLQGGVQQPGPLRGVCSVPVRLALTCEVFSRTGRVPEDLTVTELYREYWDARVHRHTGVAGSAQADRKEVAALAVAAEMVSPMGRIALRVPKGSLGAEHREGLALLASEGVLRDLGTGWEFFHQTFAEFAHARWALSQGPGSSALARLVAGVSAGQRNLWPVVRSLLLQINDDGDYRDIAEAIPADDPEGAQIHVLVALRRDDDGPLERILSRAGTSPESMAAVLPVLADAPTRHVDAAFDCAARLLQEHPTQLVGAAATTLAALLPRMEPDRLRERLATALDAALSIKADLPRSVWEQYPATMLQGFAADGLSPTALGEVWNRYRRFGSPGRQAAIRVFLARPGSSTDATVAARIAFRVKCPTLDDAEAIRFLRLAWESPELRAERSWGDWLDLLADPLPGAWINGQILLLVQLADEDRALLDTIVDDLLLGRVVAGKQHVNVLLKLVARHPAYICDRLLDAEPPQDPLGFGGIADCAAAFAAALDRDRRQALLEWLDGARVALPRRVWPTRAVLAADDVDLHRALIAELSAADEPTAVVDSVLDAWLHNSAPDVLGHLTSELRPLMASKDRRLHRALLEGCLVHRDAAARQWITTQLLRGQSGSAAGRAVMIVIETLRAIQPVTPDLAAWLTALLPSPHTDAVRRLADALTDRTFVSDWSLIPVLRSGVLIDRLRDAIAHVEDGVLIEKLIELLIRLDGVRALTAAEVVTVYDLNRSRLPRDLHDLHDLASGQTAAQSSAVRHIARLCGTLMARRLTSEEIWTRLRELLTGLNPDHLGTKMKKTVSSILIGFGHRDPRSLDWAEELFGGDDVSAAVQWAIAEALLVVSGKSASGRAARLKGHPRCPPTVLAHLLNKLQGQ